MSYSTHIFTLNPSIFCIYSVLFNASNVAFEYALTNPPVPKRIPPKYLVTTTKIFDNPCSKIIFNIGLPAVPPWFADHHYTLLQGLRSLHSIAYANTLCFAS